MSDDGAVRQAVTQAVTVACELIKAEVVNDVNRTSALTTDLVFCDDHDVLGATVMALASLAAQLAVQGGLTPDEALSRLNGLDEFNRFRSIVDTNDLRRQESG